MGAKHLGPIITKRLFKCLKEELAVARDGLITLLSVSEGQNHSACFLLLMSSKKTRTSLIKSN